MHTIEEKNIQIIGVDAGYGNIKTANTVFATGITAYDHEPMFGGNVMEYQGKWYRIGEGHKAFNPDKTCDEDFRLLTYAAIAAELAHHEMTSAQVQLAAGLPLSWTARHREEFRSYLMENRDIRLRFNDEDYRFTLVGCHVFPQGYSALVPMIYYNQNRFSGTTVMADIGNGTLDTLFMVNGKPDENRCFTEELGVKQCIMAIRKELSNRYALNVEEPIIQQALLTGTADLDRPYLDVIFTVARQYVAAIFNTLHSYGYDPRTMRLFIVGGGGVLVQSFGQYDKRRTEIITDLCANAKGFEFLAFGLTWGEKRALR